MTVKITISFFDPEDPEAFVSHYVNTHVPLVNDLPGLRAGKLLSKQSATEQTRTTRRPSRARL